MTASRYGGSGNDIVINATKNAQWKILGRPSWLSLDKKSGTGSAVISTNYKANKGKKNRTATLKIQCYIDGKWKTIDTIGITQYGTTSRKW